MTVRSRNTILILLTVVFLSLAGFAGYYFWQQTQKEDKPAPVEYSSQAKSHTVQTTQTSSAETLISQVKTAVGGTAATVLEARAPRAQVPTYSFFTSPLATEKTQVAFPRAEAELAGVYKTALDQLKAYGLSQATTSNPAPGTALATVDYSNNQVYCQLGKTQVSQGQPAISLSCADKTMYETTSKRVKILHDVYVEAQNPKPGNDLYFSDFVAYSSTIQGYSHAEILVAPPTGNTYTALFYQTPDQKWHFFKTATNTLACTDFNTPELKSAYLNQSCIKTENNAQKPSTVQL